MSDRELLEMAAKAAGEYAPKKDCPNGWEGINPEGLGCFVMGGEGRIPDYQWNPLRDDGDALRLASKLELMLNIESGVAQVIHAKLSSFQIKERRPDDVCSAARRAIVRAAAEIGRSMP